MIYFFQFVELKGSVFKKFDKNNLFQLSCADVRERFHLTMLLLAVSLQTMKEYAWRADRLAVLLPDCICLLLAEVLVDWVNFCLNPQVHRLGLINPGTNNSIAIPSKLIDTNLFLTDLLKIS